MTQITLKDIKPKLSSIEGGQALATTTTTYNDSSVSYADTSQIYGGSDRGQFRSPWLYVVETRTPNMNDPMMRTILLSKAIDQRPKMDTIYNTYTQRTRNLREGSPMGLLIALTYDQSYAS